MDYLLVDMGNTAMKWCLAPSHRKRLGPVYTEAWNRAGSASPALASSMAKAIARQISKGASAGLTGLAAGRLRLIYCSVASAERTEALVVALCEALKCEARPFRSQARLVMVPRKTGQPEATCELVNCYKTPGQLGSDRWAALWGFVASPLLWRAGMTTEGGTEGSVVVVSAGTATVMDWLSMDTCASLGINRFYFQGGTIRPGYGLMAKVLGESAARLGPQSPGVTRRAMQEGIAQAQVSGVFSRSRPCLVVVHGGYARQWLKDYFNYFGAAGQTALYDKVKRPVVIHAPTLILEGLRAWGRA